MPEINEPVILLEPVSKRCSSVKIKAGDHFNQRNTWEYFED